MTKVHSTGAHSRSQPPTKPAKPSPDFPLFAHATGRWAKKIRGRLVYFGKWDDPDAALSKYLSEKDDLHAGRTPAGETGPLTVHDLCTKFLATKKHLREAGELSPRSFYDYADTCTWTIQAPFGKNRLVSDLRPADFEKLRAKLAKKWGPVRLGNEINRVRIVFNYAYKSGLIDRPMVYGEGFKRPSKKTLRSHRHAQGLRMFEAEEIRRLLKAAGQPLKSMILLGVNCGFGNSDCVSLPLSALDFVERWVNYPRPKTGINRRCPLWPETARALREAISARPTPTKSDDAGLVFVTSRGRRWESVALAHGRKGPKLKVDSPVTKEMRKLLDSLDINGNRNFYALRHTFETIGGESKDQVAVDSIMGHARDDMASVYRERVSDSRLKAVADHVRKWLFDSTSVGKKRLSKMSMPE